MYTVYDMSNQYKHLHLEGNYPSLEALNTQCQVSSQEHRDKIKSKDPQIVKRQRRLHIFCTMVGTEGVVCISGGKISNIGKVKISNE